MSELSVRRATEHDLPQVLDLLRAAMHRSDDERFTELFRWKHLDNAYGPSPAWVAEDGDRIVAVRYLMRWEFERSGEVLRAVRAVDTATHPDYQGRGLFRTLTTGAIDDLLQEGTDFIFNTPNDQSRPGYLKMGWKLVGVLPVPTRPLSVVGLVKMAKARVAADHFSTPATCGDPAADVLVDGFAVEQLLAQRPALPRLRSRLTPEVLQWRFGGTLLTYRAISTPDGIGVFRFRRRGPARELAIAALLSPTEAGSKRLARAILRAARSHADYAVAIGAAPLASFVSVPKAGPTLVWRALANDDFPSLGEWSLTLGDIELF